MNLISVSRVVKLWRESLSKVNQKAAESLADPTEYENLFPGLKEAFVAEEYVKQSLADLRPAKEYPLVTVSKKWEFLFSLKEKNSKLCKFCCKQVDEITYLNIPLTCLHFLYFSQMKKETYLKKQKALNHQE